MARKSTAPLFIMAAAVLGWAAPASAQPEPIEAPPAATTQPEPTEAPPAATAQPEPTEAPPAATAPTPIHRDPIAPAAPLGPARLDYDQEKPIPPGYHVYSEIRTGLAISGGVMFWAAYIPPLVISWVGVRTECELQLKPLYCDEGLGYYPLNVPFAGPFVAIYTLETDARETVGLIALGALQTVGAGVFLAGFVAPKKVLVRDAVVRDITLTPRIGKDTLGLSIHGSM